MTKIYITATLLTAALSGYGLDVQNVPAPARVPMKALPIYSNELISEAPAGETVKGIRDCYSCIFKGGDSYRGFQKGVLGEYVVGEDGCVYLRNVCYDAHIDTYLKLDKVDESTYVAHTPQLIWVDDLADGSLFTAYATRVAFSQKSATSFGYEVQQTPDGGYDTDIYFTLENGKLSQKNMNTTEMNGEVFPEELIGFTTSTGGWIGFGDGCLEIYSPESLPTTLPAGAEVVEKSLDYTLLHVRDIVLDNATTIRYSEVGDDLYLSNPSAETEQWLKGSIDRSSNTVTFTKQFLGIDDRNGYGVWFVPATYGKYLDVLNDETGFGDWFRTYEETDKLVFDYSDGVLTGRKGEALYFSHSSDELLMTGVYADPAVRKFVSESLTPAKVTFTKYEPLDDLWGFGVIGFSVPAMSTEGIYIPTEELYYNVFVNDETEPFLFSPKDYIDMEVDAMTDVPYSYYESFDFKVSGPNHTVYFYQDWKRVGVQVIQKHDGTETRSEIVYIGEGSSVEGVSASGVSGAQGTCKQIENGRIVIVRDGKKYDTLGRMLK